MITMANTKPLTAIMNGAGHRGLETYGNYALDHPEQIKFIAVADPNPDRRKKFQKLHHIPDDMAFSSWELMMPLNGNKLADIAFICTQDRMHYEPAMRAMDLGYQIFLEKPISPVLKQCQALAQKAKETKRIVQVGHVLRFTPFFQKIKEVIQSGKLGKILQIEHTENVSYWHYGHSYVRGPYHKENFSSPLILAKTCHDLDLIYWYLDEQPLDVRSVGALTHYCPENAPEGSPERCTDGCPQEASCPWFAPRLYIKAEPLLRIGQHSHFIIYRLLSKWAIKNNIFIRFLAKFNKRIRSFLEWPMWPITAISEDLSYEGRMKALREGPYGKCIYKTGNDVVDHQTATFRFPGGTTATLRVIGISDLEGREVKIFGTKGTLRGVFRYNEEKLIYRDFRYNNTEILLQSGMNFDAHGGGDSGIMDAFIKVLRKEAKPEEMGTADIFASLESHYMGFAAEDARITNETRLMADYRKT